MKTKLLLLLALVLVAAACAPAMRVRYFAGQGGFPPTSPDTVDLLRQEPRRAHVAFAEIRYDPPLGTSRFEAEQQLKVRGAQIGADALVIEVDNVYRERVWVGPYRMHRRVYRDKILIGIAIRYK